MKEDNEKNKNVKQSHSEVDVGSGAMKAGTTWLGLRLSELPDVYIPPMKELHYFDRSTKYPSPNTFHKKYFFERMLYLIYWKTLRDRLVKPLFSGDFSDIRWKLHYFFGKVGDAWYRKLFSKGAGLICGEITPAYSMLDEEDISKMFFINEDLKIILILRDPVTRGWSHFKHSNKRLLKDYKYDLDLDRVKSFLKNERQTRRSDYEKIIEKYRKFAKEGNFMICFYDELQTNPQRLVSNVAKFLGSRHENISENCQFGKRANASKIKLDIPEEIQNFLIEYYRPKVKQLSLQYGSYFKIWHDRYNNKQDVDKIKDSETFIIL